MDRSANLWRSHSPANLGWVNSARPDTSNKYLIISCDTHLNEPVEIWTDRLSRDLVEQLPRVEVDSDGQKWMVAPGMSKVRLLFHEGEGEEEDKERVRAARSCEQIIADMKRDGVDLQIAFPNKGLMLFAVAEILVMYSMAAAYNDWLAESFLPIRNRVLPMAVLPASDVDLSLKELDRIGRKGFFRGVLLPTRVTFGPHITGSAGYNVGKFDPLWARLHDMNLTAT